MKKLHAHEVLDMMGTKTYTEELLKKEILEKFGEDTLFYTCSAEDMNADELIEGVSKHPLYNRRSLYSRTFL